MSSNFNPTRSLGSTVSTKRQSTDHQPTAFYFLFCLISLFQSQNGQCQQTKTVWLILLNCSTIPSYVIKTLTLFQRNTIHSFQIFTSSSSPSPSSQTTNNPFDIHCLSFKDDIIHRSSPNCFMNKSLLFFQSTHQIVVHSKLH
jgi:hypothetical protein